MLPSGLPPPTERACLKLPIQGRGATLRTALPRNPNNPSLSNTPEAHARPKPTPAIDTDDSNGYHSQDRCR
jgi:hypothetical protein